MKLYDCHLHTAFSGDSETAPEEMMEKALSLGLAGITVTDHLDLDYVPEPGLFDLDIPAYTKRMEALQKEYERKGLTVKIGIEMGLKPGLAERHREILASYPFDYVIGSIHVVSDRDPYYPDFYEGITADDAYRSYFSCCLENLRAFSDFDALGHLDYIVRYGMRHYGADKGALQYKDFAAEIDAILTFLIDHEKALEVNTGSFRNGMSEPNPSYRILLRYYELGGRMITLGADAHEPSTVADHFEEVVRHLSVLGFDRYLVYEKRTPHEVRFD